MRKLIFTLSFLVINVSNLLGQTQLTVYNHGQALVKEQFSWQLPKGVSEIELENVAETLNPSTVKLSSEQELQVLEQNYRYDLVDQDKLMKKYLGSEVSIVLRNNDKMNGELLSFDNLVLVIKNKKGIDIVQRGHVGSINCPVPSERLYVRPTLSWSVHSPKAQQMDLDLSYLTSSIAWKAEYVAVISDKNEEMELSSWINLDNKSGKDFDNAKLKLVAGDLNRARPKSRSRYQENAITLTARSVPVVEERNFFEYHLYEIAFPVTVHNREEKQIQWLSPTKIKSRKRYEFQGGGSSLSSLPVKIQFRNDEKSGTGIPLPAGMVRLFMKDTDGALELIGEDHLNHTAKKEWVSFNVGKAFDVKGKRVVMDRRSKQNKFNEEDIKVTLVNRKDIGVEVDVLQSGGYENWQIMNESMPFVKVNASLIKFTVSVPADSQVVLTYTTHQSMK